MDKLRNHYEDEILLHLARIADGNFTPNWTKAFPVATRWARRDFNRLTPSTISQTRDSIEEILALSEPVPIQDSPALHQAATSTAPSVHRCSPMHVRLILHPNIWPKWTNSTPLAHNGPMSLAHHLQSLFLPHHLLYHHILFRTSPTSSLASWSHYSLH